MKYVRINLLIALGLWCTSTLAAVPGFELPTSYQTGNQPYVAATGDFNNDGFADTVTANWTDTTVSVFINNGDGTFAAKVDYPSGDTTTLEGTQVANTGDLNGDGNVDIIVSNYYGFAIFILWNNGDSTFSAPEKIVSSNYPGAIVIEDFNNDGDLDFSFSSGDVFVYLNDGSGNFTLSHTQVIGNWTWTMVSADFDNDGIKDLAVNETDISVLNVMFGNGDGTFGTPVEYASGGTWPKPLAALDMNNDNHIDLVVGNDIGDVVVVFTNDGTGHFISGASANIGVGLQSGMATLDYNQDGLTDFVVTNNGGNNFSVVMNNGDGTLGEVVEYNTFSAIWPTSADFNNDGVDDLAVSSWYGNYLNVFLNQPALQITVLEAELDLKDNEVEFEASISLDELPAATDILSASFDGVELGSIDFGSLREKKAGKFKFEGHDFEVKLNWNKKEIEFEAEGLDLSGIDLNDGVEIIVTIGSASGSDTIVMIQSGHNKYEFGDDDDDHHDD